jgi:hypothetical protein
LSPRGEQYARKLPELVRESVGVSQRLIVHEIQPANRGRMTDP